MFQEELIQQNSTKSQCKTVYKHICTNRPQQSQTNSNNAPAIPKSSLSYLGGENFKHSWIRFVFQCVHPIIFGLIKDQKVYPWMKSNSEQTDTNRDFLTSKEEVTCADACTLNLLHKAHPLQTLHDVQMIKCVVWFPSIFKTGVFMAETRHRRDEYVIRTHLNQDVTQSAVLSHILD